MHSNIPGNHSNKTRAMHIKGIANAMVQHAGNDEAAIRMTAAIRGTKAAAELAQNKALSVLQRPLPRASTSSEQSLEALIRMAASDAQPVRAAWSRFVKRFGSRGAVDSKNSTQLAQALAMYALGSTRSKLSEATANEYLKCMSANTKINRSCPQEAQARLDDIFQKLISISATARLMSKEFPGNESASQLRLELSDDAVRTAMIHVLQKGLYAQDMVEWFRDNEDDACDAFTVHMTMYRRGAGHFGIHAKHANNPSAMPHHAAIKALVPYARNGDSLSIAAHSFARVQPHLNQLRRLEARLGREPNHAVQIRAEMDQIRDVIDTESREYLAHARLVNAANVNAAALAAKRRRRAAVSKLLASGDPNTSVQNVQNKSSKRSYDDALGQRANASSFRAEKRARL